MSFKEGDRVVATQNNVSEEGVIAHIYDDVAVIKTSDGMLKTTINNLTRAEIIEITRDDFFNRGAKVIKNYINEFKSEEDITDDELTTAGVIAGTMLMLLETELFGERETNDL